MADQRRQVEEFLKLKTKYESEIQTYRNRTTTLEMEMKSTME